MDPFGVYHQVLAFLQTGKFRTGLDFALRKKIKRMANNFLVKDNRLFYKGPHKQSMRLVVLSNKEKEAILQECHNNPGTGNHCGKRATRNRVTAGYFWPTIQKDVTNWVRRCYECQINDPMKTVAPVLHSIKVTEPWEVLGMDLIGPLPKTPLGNSYVITMTDLYTKWVVAEPLQNKTAVEVASVLVSKMYTFGFVKKIITDQGKEFVNQLNERIFKLLDIKHSVSSAYHPQTNGQDETTNQIIKEALRKYVNQDHTDWDLHLPAVVYGINTAKQSSTKYSPFFLMYHRYPHLPEMLNVCQVGDQFEVEEAEEGMEKKLEEFQQLNQKVLQNIQKVQLYQQKSFGNRKRHFTKVCSQETGDQCLILGDPKKRISDTLSSQHRGPHTITTITPKGVATVVKGSSRQKDNVSRLRPYNSSNIGQHTQNLQDHAYCLLESQEDHNYTHASAKWEEATNPVQEELRNPGPKIPYVEIWSSLMSTVLMKWA